MVVGVFMEEEERFAGNSGRVGGKKKKKACGRDGRV